MNLLRCILTESDCYKKGKKITPKGVMIHSTGANNPNIRRYVQPSKDDPNYNELMTKIGHNKNGNSWNNPGVSKCVHGFVGKLADGSIASVQTLEWDHRGWHAGSGTTRSSANNTHISFEICEDGLDDPVYFAQVYREAVELTAMLCSIYNLNPLQDEVIICHAEGNRLGMASSHVDVEHWFPKFGKTMDDFRREVAEELNTIMAPIDEEPPNGCSLTYEQFREMMDQYRTELQDNQSADWSREGREWCVRKGLIVGSGSTINGEPNYMWHDFLTREQAATLFYRFAKMMGMI